MNQISKKLLANRATAFCGAIFLAFITPSVKAEQLFKSAEHHVQIAFPDAWSMMDRKAPGAIIGYGRSQKNADDTISIASCNLASTESPSTNGKKQEQINSDLEKALNSGTLAKNYLEAGLTVTETYTRTVGGVRALVVVGKMTENVYGKNMELVRQLSLFFTPGTGYVLTCQADSLNFSKESHLFDRVSNSIRLK